MREMTKPSKRLANGMALVAIALALTACGEKKTELGQGGSEVSGSAGPGGGQGAHASLERCDAPIATVALLENPRGYVVPSSLNLPPTPVPLVRLLMQQSGCFRVVDRAGGLQGTIREGELQDAGVLRPMARCKSAKAMRPSTPWCPT